MRGLSGALLGSRRSIVRSGPSYGLGGNQMYALLTDTESGKPLSVMCYQGGFGDVIFAAWVFEEARRRGLRQEIEP